MKTQLDMAKKLPVACYIVSAVLVIAFFVKSIVDYTQYLDSYNSAPFHVWVLVNAMYFIIPAIIVFVIGAIVKKRQK